VRLRPRWKDQHHAQAVPQGVPGRRDRCRPARRPVDRAGRPQLSESCLARWLKIADRDEGRADAGTAAADGDLEAENRELRKRAKQLEQENEILRRATAYFARDVLPK
jgi:transposase-like protein